MGTRKGGVGGGENIRWGGGRGEEKEVGKVWKILEDKSELGIGEEKRGERRKGDGEEGR